MSTKYTDFWKEFELIHEFIYLSINHRAVDQGLQAMNNIIKKHKILCGIKINIQTGFRNNLPCPERDEQNEIVLSMDYGDEDGDKAENSTCTEHIIEALFSTFYKLFPDSVLTDGLLQTEKHPVRDWWHVIKYTPRCHTKSITTLELTFNPVSLSNEHKHEHKHEAKDDSDVIIKSSDFTFHPIVNKEGKMDIIIFVDDRKDKYLLKESINKNGDQIFLGHQYIKVMILNVIGEYMHHNYINVTEFYPNILFEKIPRMPLYKLYDTMVDKLNLSNLFITCKRCLLNNYQQYLITKKIIVKKKNISIDASRLREGWFCDNTCYEAFIEKNESLEDIAYG